MLELEIAQDCHPAAVQIIEDAYNKLKAGQWSMENMYDHASMTLWKITHQKGLDGWGITEMHSAVVFFQNRKGKVAARIFLDD